MRQLQRQLNNEKLLNAKEIGKVDQLREEINVLKSDTSKTTVSEGRRDQKDMCPENSQLRAVQQN